MTVRQLRHDRISLPTIRELPSRTCGMTGFHCRPPWHDRPAHAAWPDFTADHPAEMAVRHLRHNRISLPTTLA